MGKRKKSKHLVKLDLGEDVVGKAKVVPLLVQQSSKDGRRVERSIHTIPAPRVHPPPTFDPSPKFATTEECAIPGVSDPVGEPCGAERVSLHSLSLKVVF